MILAQNIMTGVVRLIAIRTKIKVCYALLASIMLVNLVMLLNGYFVESDQVSAIFFGFNVITAGLLVLVLAINYPPIHEKGWEKPVLELVLCPAVGTLVACTYIISIVMTFTSNNLVDMPLNFPNYPVIFISCIALTGIFAYNYYLKYFA
jgi:hypothetical protein